MSTSSRKIDRLAATFDHDGIVANAGLIVAATLMARLGLEASINTGVRTGSSRPGRKVLTVVAAMLAGGTHIDHVAMLRAGATERVLGFKPMAPSTIGTFLRSWKLIRRLDAHGIAWSITVTANQAVKAAFAAIAGSDWADIDYTLAGRAQVAETSYTTGGGRTKRKQQTVRLIVRRTRLADPDQAALWPDWRHHSFITNTTRDAVAADQFHREHAAVELAIRDLKEGTGAEHIPSGHYAANAAWFACAVLAHNLGIWTSLLADQPRTTHRTRRTRLIALAAVIVNRSGRHTLRFPARWPWAKQFHHTLAVIRALPEPSD